MKPFSVAVTGVGVAHALGLSWPEFGSRLAKGECGLRNLDEHPFLGSHPSTARVFSWLPALPPPTLLQAERAHLASGLTRLALHCAAEAVSQPDRGPPQKSAVVLGTGFANLADLDPVYRRYFNEGPRRLSPLTVPVNMANSAANVVSQSLGWEGPSSTVSAACASGLKAVIDACRLLAEGRADRVLAGGADLTVCPSLIDAWDKLRVLSPETDPSRACRPLAVDRPGLVLGEVAALFQLERLDEADGPVLGVLRGGYETCDAFDLVAPRAETQLRCLVGTLAGAGIAPADVGAVHLHATGTALNDRQELEVLESLLGPALGGVTLAAIKSQTGHAMGASGALSLAAALHTLATEQGFPLNVDQPDWNGPLTLHPQGVPEHTLMTCYAFGGTNCSILLSRN